MKPTFDAPNPTPTRATRDTVHYASQLVAAAGQSLLEPDPHFHYSSTSFDPDRGALVGAPLPDGRQVALSLASLTLSVGDESLSMRGKTSAEAAAWLESALAKELTFPDWDLPNGPYRDQTTFDASDDELAKLTHWYHAAWAALAAFTPSHGAISTIRVWPHHFDIAVLVTLQEAEAGDPEAMKSVGVGMTPGDGGIADPYLYLGPWPYPSERVTPPLPSGRWNVEGWYGAVLEAAAIESDSQVQTFFQAAFDHLAQGLGFG